MTVDTYLRLCSHRSTRRAAARKGRKIAVMAWTLFSFLGLTNCGGVNPSHPHGRVITPRIVTERVLKDSDDPAIWIHPDDPSKSLIVGTDKHETNGGLYAFGLDGRIIANKTVTGLKRPNNVDVEYGLILQGAATDIAVATERYTDKLRAYRLPDMLEIDNGGLPVFEGEGHRDPMGIALYKRPADGAVFAIVGRTNGPTNGGYLWQYRLEDDGSGKVKATKVREFGIWSGRKEIEAIAADDPLGYVYYSDEGYGIRKYAADPDAPNAGVELALFGTTGFAEDQEGICVYQTSDTTGYLIVSDQSADRLQIFTREGEPGGPHNHRLVKTVRVAANDTDGVEVTNVPLSDKFPGGLLVAMSHDATFHYYSWEDIAGENLATARKQTPTNR